MFLTRIDNTNEETNSIFCYDIEKGSHRYIELTFDIDYDVITFENPIGSRVDSDNFDEYLFNAFLILGEKPNRDVYLVQNCEFE